MRQLICKKTKTCKYADEFVIYDTGKIKDRRVKPLVYKQLKKKQLMELRKVLRDNAEYLEKIFVMQLMSLFLERYTLMLILLWEVV